MNTSSATVKGAWKLPQTGNVATFGQKVIKIDRLTTSEAGNVATTDSADASLTGNVACVIAQHTSCLRAQTQ